MRKSLFSGWIVAGVIAALVGGLFDTVSLATDNWGKGEAFSYRIKVGYSSFFSSFSFCIFTFNSCLIQIYIENNSSKSAGLRIITLRQTLFELL